MTTQHISKAAGATGVFLAVPWAAFVAVFLYYVGLTLVAISVEQLPDLAMAASYLLPVAGYGLLLLSRMVRAAAAMPVEIGHWAQPRLQ